MSSNLIQDIKMQLSVHKTLVESIDYIESKLKPLLQDHSLSTIISQYSKVYTLYIDLLQAHNAIQSFTGKGIRNSILV